MGGALLRARVAGHDVAGGDADANPNAGFFAELRSTLNCSISSIISNAAATALQVRRSISGFSKATASIQATIAKIRSGTQTPPAPVLRTSSERP